MTVIVDTTHLGHTESEARPSARRRLAKAAVVAAAMIAGVLAWRWALVEATTDYASPDSLATEPVVRLYAKHTPPPMELEVTVLDVHTAPPAPAARATHASVKSGAAEARVPAPASSTKTRR
ncbi:MAG TPA: hypothetical protein VLM79_37275 [Kofleriaceae bacterium]|nr:hypothetical protein [Kofleriaceae bacterium]